VRTQFSPGARDGLFGGGERDAVHFG
jgi:hypothetical protein